ncbi:MULTISPECIES: glycosyltransferase family 2 protein [Pseudomonadaceae]|uniref:glycosyltransferase family 2 protein n=1 Tax=Pseudomonadaceae TaxID=135621 RepID=UPI001ADACFE5|nr:glycosyltransferase family 2 protein [Pseudomonas alcaligenes]EKU6308813.1 glycosyltransferase family 2 protein [Pseudomonas aeruginosa]ELN4741038.1 glycosyltransferase family 2 protein [Escherichia coli]EKX2970391.1 glycosyltransferase family 2 protein [Pseudomonas aeruginosa]MBO8337008.1 glycosyltransferase family 2 protein [Pseudomonas aeruginosa]BDC78590.1 glycosyl transferase family 2 [Pseudomonas alcaligenes]
MSKNLKIILLSVGSNTRPLADGEYPDFLTERDGQPVIQTLIEGCALLNPSKIICMFSSTDMNKLHLRNMVQQMHPAATAYAVQGETKGAACTALLAAGEIDNDDELVILSTSELLDVSLPDVVESFRENGDDAGVVIFKSVHPRYSFVRLTPANKVVEAAEKNPITPHAIAGMYWFKTGALFVAAVKNMIRKDAKVNDSFYIAPALNELVLLHKQIGSFRIDQSQYHPLKTLGQIHAHSQGAAR